MERVTVLIAVYNAEETIFDTIQSVLNQTFQDFKISILNDSSTDRSIEIIENFKSNKIEITHLKEKKVIGGLNAIIDSCQSEYLARLDHDDLMLPTRLEEQVKFMDENPGIIASGSYVETFGNYNTVWTRFRANERQLRQNFFWFNSIMHTSCIVRNHEMKKHGINYNREYAFIDGENDYPLTEDYKFCYDLSKAGRLSNIPKVLTKYRKHDQQTSISKRNIQDFVANKIRREGIIDFLNKYGLSITEIDPTQDLSTLLKQIKSLKVEHNDKWHLAMSQYMLIQSCKHLSIFQFLSVLFTTRLVIDRNIAELVWKMIRTKAGADEKLMI